MKPIRLTRFGDGGRRALASGKTRTPRGIRLDRSERQAGNRLSAIHRASRRAAIVEVGIATVLAGTFGWFIGYTIAAPFVASSPEQANWLILGCTFGAGFLTAAMMLLRARRVRTGDGARRRRALDAGDEVDADTDADHQPRLPQYPVAGANPQIDRRVDRTPVGTRAWQAGLTAFVIIGSLGAFATGRSHGTPVWPLIGSLGVGLVVGLAIFLLILRGRRRGQPLFRQAGFRARVVRSHDYAADVRAQRQESLDDGPAGGVDRAD